MKGGRKKKLGGRERGRVIKLDDVFVCYETDILCFKKSMS
jgi:hypothetical protein